MPKVVVADSFARSVELEYDYQAGKRVGAYLITAKARELLARFESEVSSNGGGAFSVIGTYGSGKSAFALFCASLLAADDSSLNKLSEADRDLHGRVKTTFSKALFPVLITGRREGIAASILRGLQSAGEGLQKEVGIGTNTDLKKWLRKVRAEQKSPLFQDYGNVADLVEEFAGLVQVAGYGGLFIVIDELGKLLEFAALHPKDSDVYLLQLLAERSVRRGETDPQLVFLTILHQAVERYAARLATSQQEEWKKVQGRFEDFAFVEPVNETTRLLASAVSASLSSKEQGIARERVSRLLKQVTTPSHIDRTQLEKQLVDAAPLSPLVSLSVGPLFRRLAQNERSLFAFLSSNEPGGFMEVVSEAAEGAFYELHHLFDYLLTAVGPTLLHGRDSRYWSEAETVLHRASGQTLHQRELIKATALLGYVGQQVGAKADKETLAASLNISAAEADRELDVLSKQKLVTYRPIQEEYVIWQGSDFDLDGWIKKARANVSDQVSVAELLTSASSLTPVIARRHAYRTGTFRFFEPKYVSASNWFVEAQKPSKWADGKLIYVVSTSEEERRIVRKALKGEEVELNPSNVVSILPDAAHIRDAAYDVLCYDWIYDHCDELAGDPSARRELSQRRVDTSAYLESELKRLVFAMQEESANWYVDGLFHEVRSPREQQQKLSELCDSLFAQSPIVWNELLNRRKPSASAVSGLKSLLRAMIDHPEEAQLGIEGTPAEFGLYESILRKGQLHRALDGFVEPKQDVLNIKPLFKAFEVHLTDAKAAKVSLGELQSMAADTPFGLRKGLFLPLVFAFILQRRNEIALYEDDALVIDIGGYELDRLVKDPARFSVQMIRIDADRKRLLQVYGEVVGVDTGELSILRVVMELIRKARKLNPYARRTGNLERRDTAVREALFRAEDPIKLLYHDLPEACGLESELESTHPENYQKFGLALESSLRAITNSYRALLLDIEEELATALLLHASQPEERRSELVERSRPLLDHATNEKFRAFLVRAIDAVMDTTSWFESLAALLAESPPKHWIDKTRAEFRKNLKEIARFYQTLEPLVFEEQGDSEAHDGLVGGQRKRVSVTSLGSEEKARVISVHPEDEELVSDVANKLLGMLGSESQGRDESFRLAVLAELADLELSKEDEHSEKAK